MKTKHIEKKLVLKRDTISNLNVKEMNVVQAGEALTKKETLCPMTCLTCDIACL